ncbi:MAG: undecaprenyl/decaprenyl-phosphate alpha-N-acetylglucosaminyl 1-phosphate transferase [Synergistaceae bacterium]|nr:undecaprenyl/decaprenyl-phosphate alpha-N-acetylglucosaminyl 1-phosphate transferase [Synergistaceae bacterium]
MYLFTLVMFLWGLIATPVSIGLAQKFRLLDIPGGRKRHRSIMPRGAGIVLWSGYLLWALFTGNPGVEVPYVATGATVVFIIGYMDDMHPLPPLFRLFFHLAAAAWVAYPLPIPLWQRMLFILWISGTTNAYNLIDGMDGLCLTVTLITSIVALYAGNAGVWMPVAGLVFGVLLWNFPQPRTFLGDGGSTLLGYICASHLAWSIFPDIFGNSFVHLVLILLLIGGVPVIDTLVAMTRRVLTKKSPLSPDRGHAHHKLQDAGLSKLSTLAVLGSLHFFLMVCGLRLMGVRIFNLF